MSGSLWNTERSQDLYKILKEVRISMKYWKMSGSLWNTERSQDLYKILKEVRISIKYWKMSGSLWNTERSQDIYKILKEVRISMKYWKMSGSLWNTERSQDLYKILKEVRISIKTLCHWRSSSSTTLLTSFWFVMPENILNTREKWWKTWAWLRDNFFPACPMLVWKLSFDIACKLFGPANEIPRFTKPRYLGYRAKQYVPSSACNVTFSH